MGAEAGIHKPHSISQSSLVHLIFFSLLANIDFLSFVSLEVYSPRLCLLSLCCCRSSITAWKTQTIMCATYLLLWSWSTKAQKEAEGSWSGGWSLLKTLLFCDASSKTLQWSGCGWAETSAQHYGWQHPFGSLASCASPSNLSIPCKVLGGDHLFNCCVTGKRSCCLHLIRIKVVYLFIIDKLVMSNHWSTCLGPVSAIQPANHSTETM